MQRRLRRFNVTAQSLLCKWHNAPAKDYRHLTNARLALDQILKDEITVSWSRVKSLLNEDEGTLEIDGREEAVDRQIAMWVQNNKARIPLDHEKVERYSLTYPFHAHILNRTTI